MPKRRGNRIVADRRRDCVSVCRRFDEASGHDLPPRSPVQCRCIAAAACPRRLRCRTTDTPRRRRRRSASPRRSSRKSRAISRRPATRRRSTPSISSRACRASCRRSATTTVDFVTKGHVAVHHRAGALQAQGGCGESVGGQRAGDADAGGGRIQAPGRSDRASRSRPRPTTTRRWRNAIRPRPTCNRRRPTSSRPRSISATPT